MDWIRRYILFHNKRHPNEMGAAKVEAFLTHLAIDQHVAASTQNQALNSRLCTKTHRPAFFTSTGAGGRKMRGGVLGFALVGNSLASNATLCRFG